MINSGKAPLLSKEGMFQPRAETGVVPLEGGRVGTLAFAATSPTLPSIPTWLNGLRSLPGFVDAVPNSVTRQEDGSYTASITMHINAEAYSGRFAPKVPDAEVTATAEDGN